MTAGPRFFLFHAPKQSPLAVHLAPSPPVAWSREGPSRKYRYLQQQNQALGSFRLAELQALQDSAFDTPLKQLDFPQNFPQLWKTEERRS
jgi:hypothetical protein